MADVKWIKIVTDVFDDEKILLIESMPDADACIVIWFKLLCLAGKQNNSGVFMMNNRIAYTDEMFSTIFRRPLNTVRMALDTFEQFGMIERIDGVVTIPNWDKHQSLDALEQKRKNDRERIARKRAEQKLLSSGVADVSHDCRTTVEATSHECRTLDKKEIREDKKEIRVEEEQNRGVGEGPTDGPIYDPLVDDNPMKRFFEERIISSLVMGDSNAANSFWKTATSRGVVLDKGRIEREVEKRKMLSV